MNVNLITFCTPNYRKCARELKRSGKQFGVDGRFKAYNLYNLIFSNFFFHNPQIFSNRTGLGYWSWKPFFIKQYLKKIEYDEWLLYVDARSVFRGSIESLLDSIPSKCDIILFSASPHKISQFTKREALERMNIKADDYAEKFQINAGIMLFKKTLNSERFIAEYLTYCCDLKTVSDKSFNSLPELPDFIEHRFDQSVSSILCLKYDLPHFQSPDQFGIENTFFQYECPVILETKLKPATTLASRIEEKFAKALYWIINKISFLKWTK